MNYSRRIVGTVVVALVVGALGLVGVTPAWAHNALTGSDPADGSSTATSPATVTLTFNDVVQNLAPLITVVGPAGDRWEGSPVTTAEQHGQRAGQRSGAGGRVHRSPTGWCPRTAIPWRAPRPSR